MSFELLTERLRIIPLDLRQFKLFLDSVEEMEKELGISISGERLEGHVKEAMEGLYQNALKNTDNYVWYTNWQIVLKEKNMAIGSACFIKHSENESEIEIGYGINTDYQNKGYMTEALEAMCKWAIEQTGITNVIAETEKFNIASHRTLQKVGMNTYKETEDSLWWRLMDR